jgi:hypothetical protein
MEALVRRFLSLVPLLVPALLVAEPPDTLWTRTVGTAGYDYGRSVIVDHESCYVAAGALGGAAYIYRVRPHGVPDYGHSCGGLRAYDLCETPGGGYALSGCWQASDSTEDVYLCRRDARGNPVWSRTWAYQGGGWRDYGYAVAACADGGFAVAAHAIQTGGHIWLLRTDSLGDTLWTRRYDVRWYWTIAWWIEQLEDGGFALVGQTSAGSESDFFLLRTDSLGDTLWSRTYGSPDEQRAYGACRAPGGGYCLVGYTEASPGTQDWYVVRTDSMGDTLWTRVFEGPYEEVAYSVCATSDNGFLVAGKCGSYNGSDMYFVRLDSDGDTLWTKRVGGPLAEVAYSVAETPDRAYVAVGSTRSFGAGESDLWMVKLAWEAGVAGSARPAPAMEILPTVVRGVLSLQSTIWIQQSGTALLDASGRRVQELGPGPNDVARLAPGVYFFRAVGATRRVVVTR